MELQKVELSPISMETEPVPTVQVQAVDGGAFDWSDLARINALIAHSTARVFAQNTDKWQRVALVHQGPCLLRASLEQEDGSAKLTEVMPRLVLYLGDAGVETCSRINALVKYSKRAMLFADCSQIGRLRVQAIRPCGPNWIELIMLEEDESVHVVRRYYEPLLLTL